MIVSVSFGAFQSSQGSQSDYIPRLSPRAHSVARRRTDSNHRRNGPVSHENMNISMSGKRALTATGPSQSAVAPRQGRRRSVPTEPVADGPFTGPSTATGPFRLVTGPVGTGLNPPRLPTVPSVGGLSAGPAAGVWQRLPGPAAAAATVQRVPPTVGQAAAAHRRGRIRQDAAAAVWPLGGQGGRHSVRVSDRGASAGGLPEMRHPGRG